jgi:hypothetical protein
MSKIVRYRFMGSWWWFWLLCVSGIGLPLAILYLLTGTVRLDTDVDDTEQIAEELYTGKLAMKSEMVVQAISISPPAFSLLKNC